MRLLVVGAGSTGGYIGARLDEAGLDVTFLVREGRAIALREQGLSIESPHGNVTIRPKLVDYDNISGPYDAVLLAVKTFQLSAALDDVAPAVGPDTAILPVLNGMRHIEQVSTRFSPHNLVGAALKIATVLEGDGRIVQLAPLQDFAYGEIDKSSTPRIQALDKFFRTANIGARLAGDINREMWEKWALLASAGAITCLARGSVGDVEQSAGGSDFARRMVDEVFSVIRAAGFDLSDEIHGIVSTQMTLRGSPFVSSMYRDIQRSRPIEADAIIGDLVQRAKLHNLDVPLLSAAYVHLSVYNRGVQKSSSV
jgi:2-dehydropantoate 2-reductase